MKSVVVILLTFLPLALVAQHVLMLEKLGRGKIYTYETGDPIVLKRVADTAKFSGIITSISDTVFVLDMKIRIRTDEVQSVWRTTYPRRKPNGNKLIIAGAALLAITAINNLSHCRTIIDPLFLGVSVGISSAGVLWRRSANQKYTLGYRWKLKTMEIQYL